MDAMLYGCLPAKSQGRFWKPGESRRSTSLFRITSFYSFAFCSFTEFERRAVNKLGLYSVALSGEYSLLLVGWNAASLLRSLNKKDKCGEEKSMGVFSGDRSRRG